MSAPVPLACASWRDGVREAVAQVHARRRAIASGRGARRPAAAGPDGDAARSAPPLLVVSRPRLRPGACPGPRPPHRRRRSRRGRPRPFRPLGSGPGGGWTWPIAVTSIVSGPGVLVMLPPARTHPASSAIEAEAVEEAVDVGNREPVREDQRQQREAGTSRPSRRCR